jgi:hypothetical protein
MDLNEHISKIVEGIVDDITSNVMLKIDNLIFSAIENRLVSFNFETHIQNAASAAFEKKVSEYNIDQKKLENKILAKINSTIDEAKTLTEGMVTNTVHTRISESNIQQLIAISTKEYLADQVNNFVFPPDSIDPTAIQLKNLEISGNNVSGGIIKNFSSTGIDDRSTQIAITVLDEAVVIENNLITKDLSVEGNTYINGSLVVTGKVPEDSEFFISLSDSTAERTLQKLDRTIFNGFSDTVFNKIKNEGIDLNKITLNGKEVFKDGQLSSTLTESNLQKVGMLKELQVAGESFLAQTFYVTNKRIGINTIEPSAVLSVWDDEVEINLSKKQTDTGIIGTPRSQKLILSSNGKNNIVLDPDGSVNINELNLGSMKFTVSDKPPNFPSTRCHVVWNSNPNHGGPLGWICLGGSNWANFGIIE